MNPPRQLPPVTPGELTGDVLFNLINREAPVFLDIGANNGGQSLWFLKLFPKAKVYAFEPDLRAFGKLQPLSADPRLQAFKMAIGAQDGIAKFHVSSGLPPGASPQLAAYHAKGWDLSGSLRAPKSHLEVWPWCKFDSTVDVEVRSLDSWAREHSVSAIDFIWADTQGAEGDLIAGGQAMLARTRFFYTEYSDEEWFEGQPTLEALAGVLPDFELIRRYKNDALFKNSKL